MKTDTTTPTQILEQTPSPRHHLIWNLWFITWLGLLAGLFFPQWYVAVVWFSVLHALLMLYLEHFRVMAFPVQVRLAYVLWVAIGTYVPYMDWLMWITTLGLTTNLFWGYCPLARMLSLLPFNRNQPLSWDLVRRTFFSPPVEGRFMP